MSRADFDNFIERKAKALEESDKLNPQRQIDEWRSFLNTLYRSVSGYMAKYVEAGHAEISSTDIELNEEFSGPYTVQDLTVSFGGSTVNFKPVGTMLIGSKGRVDVRGPHGVARLVLVDKNVSSSRQLIKVRVSIDDKPLRPEPERASPPEWTWKLVSPPPEMQFTDLTEDTFFDMLLSVADA
uniref:hypothetical protein n=1 Tax=uncultured Caulobacter sp. TaxID=158749 RepID=UPI0025DCADA6|nr:hypothetical protein [uncultured Caulobacter sp.]